MKRIAAVLVALGVALSFTPTQAVTAPPTTDKVLVIVLENHSAAQIRAGAPYLTSLGATYGTATDAHASTHPSKPNYAIMAAGETRGITSDSTKRVHGPSVFGATIKAGRSAKTMAESMGSDRCRHSNYGKYVEKHNPQEFYTDENALCERYNFSYDKYGASDIAAGKLGNVEFIIPNNCNNAHDCSLGTFDRWLKAQMARILAGPDWTSGRLTVVIIADEDDRNAGNVIPLVVVHPSLSGKVVSSRLDLCSLNAALTDFGHAARMGCGKTAASLTDAFGLVVQ